MREVGWFVVIVQLDFGYFFSNGNDLPPMSIACEKEVFEFWPIRYYS